MDNFFDKNPYDITKKILEDPESTCTHIHTSKIQAISAFLNLKIGSRVLDCGCGTGFASLFFPISNQYKFFSIDTSNIEISLAKRYSNHLNRESEWLVGDGFHLPFKDNSFDAAFCVALLHHLDNYPKILDEMARVSRKIVLCEPNKYCPRQWLYQRTEGAKLAGDTKAFSVNKLEENLRNAGLHNIQFMRINFIPQTTKREQIRLWKKIESSLLGCNLTNIFAGTIVIYGEK